MGAPFASDFVEVDGCPALDEDAERAFALGFLLRGLDLGGVGVVTLSLERVLANASTEPGAVSDWYRSATERGLLRTTMSSSEKAAGERAPWERMKTGD